MVMSARVLNAKGVELRNRAVHVHTPDANASESTNFADGFASLFTELNLQELLNAPAVPQAAKSTATQPQGLSSMRISSYVMFGLAAAGTVAGATFTMLYARDNSNYKKLMDGKSAAPPNSSEKAYKYMQSARDNRNLFIVSYAFAAATAATGVTLYFLSPEYKNKASVAFLPLQGGGALALSANF